MALPNGMQVPKKNSISTTLNPGITDSDAIIPVQDLSVFYDSGSNLITSGIVLGFDDAIQTYAEEITIAGASGTSGAGNLTGATRGISADGTIGAARAWTSGTTIAVILTSTQIKAFKANLEYVETWIANPVIHGGTL